MWLLPPNDLSCYIVSLPQFRGKRDLCNISLIFTTKCWQVLISVWFAKGHVLLQTEISSCTITALSRSVSTTNYNIRIYPFTIFLNINMWIFRVTYVMYSLLLALYFPGLAYLLFWFSSANTVNMLNQELTKFLPNIPMGSSMVSATPIGPYNTCAHSLYCYRCPYYISSA